MSRIEFDPATESRGSNELCPSRDTGGEGAIIWPRSIQKTEYDSKKRIAKVKKILGNLARPQLSSAHVRSVVEWLAGRIADGFGSR